MNERKKAAFNFVADVSKHLTAVSAAIIALSVTFHRELAGGGLSVPWTLPAAVLCYLITVLAGAWTLLALTGALGQEPQSSDSEATAVPQTEKKQQGIPDEKLSIYDWNIRMPTFIQLLSFALALVFTAGFSWSRLLPPKPSLSDLQQVHRHIQAGTRCLLVATGDDVIIPCALGRASLAFQNSIPPSAVRPHLDSIYAISFRVLGQQPRRNLSPDERGMLIDAYWQIDTIMARLSR